MTTSFIEGIEALVAYREKAHIRARTLDARRAKARAGELMGNGETPFGYRRAGEKGRYTWEIVEDEARIVRQVFAWRASGVGTQTIVKRLTDSGTPTPADVRGRKQRTRKRAFGVWNHTTIYKMLRNSSYVGVGRTFRQKVIGETLRGSKKYAIRDPSEWFTFVCPQIVDQTTWDSVQRKLDVGQQQSPRRSKYEYLVGRRIRCDECKAAIVGRPAYNGQYQYYACGGTRALSYTANPGCTLPTVRKHLVDDAVWGWISGVLLDEVRLREKAASNAEEDSAARRKIEERRLEVAAAIADLDIERKRYQSLFGRGRMTESEFDAADDGVTARKAGLREELARYTDELDSLASPEQLDSNLEAVTVYRPRLASADFETRRGVIDDLDVAVVLYRRGRELWAEAVSHVFRVRDDLFICNLRV